MSNILKVENLVKNYGSHHVLREVNLDIASGVIHGLLGPNGVGKTTFLHIVTGILHYNSGTVSICGFPVGETRARSYLGFVPDDLPLPHMLTGEEFLSFNDSMRGIDTREKSYEIAEIFDIFHDLSRSIGEYSHGMKRKLQTIAAISHNPKLLIFDEPFRGLDPRSIRLMREVIYRFASQGSAVLIATHDMTQAQNLCDSASIIYNGRIIVSDEVAKILTQCTVDTLEDAFFSLTGEYASVTEAVSELAKIIGD